MSSTFIVDNGSYSMKAGYKDDLKPKIIPNYIFKTSSETYVANEIDNCLEPSNLYLNSPFERGYLVHMDTQNDIWQEMFGRRQFGVNFSDTKLILTDSNLTVPTIETSVREILFETYGFHSLQLCSAPGLVAQYNYEKTKIPHSLIIDSGHSFTHILPCLSGKICVERSMRIDIGGKIMTNFLRDKLTYSQFDLRQETKVVNEMKEDVCYFAKDFRQEMDLFKKNNPFIEYYLPDYNILRRGQIRQASTDLESYKDLSKIILGVERFVLPETLFFPEITNCDQIGLKDAIYRTCNGVFNYNLFGRHMLQNIIVFGGNAAIPGLKDRLCFDLSNAFESFDAPKNIEKCINVSSNPIIEPWLAAQYLTTNNISTFMSKFVSKKEYHEQGGNRICDERFIDYAPKEWYEHVEDGPFLDENGEIMTDSDDEFETPMVHFYPSVVAPPQPIVEPPSFPPADILPSASASTTVQPIIDIPKERVNDADTDIIEVGFIPSPTKPPARALLKARRILPPASTSTVRPQSIIQKVVVPQSFIKRPEPSPPANVQYYTAVSDGGGPTRLIRFRPTRIQTDIPQQQYQQQPQPRFQPRLPILPSSIIRIRSQVSSPAPNSMNVRPMQRPSPSSEMPILRPQIARQVPVMLPRGMLNSGGPNPAFRGRTILIRRALPRSQYVPVQQQHHQQHLPLPPPPPQHQHQQQQPQHPQIQAAPTFRPRQGLEEEYESGESGPSTPL